MTSLRIPVDKSDHAQGAADAPATLVEYGDYQCPHCGAAYPVVQRLQQRFAKDLRFVFRNFPLTEVHPEALNAAVTAEFGAANGRFWEIHDALFENQQELGIALYDSIASQLGLDVDALHAALESEQYFEKVRRDFNGGVRSGVNGTPTFFINGKRHEGLPDFASLEEALALAIRSA